MKSVKEALFENALYCKDKARTWKESHGEWDNPVYDMYKNQYNILLNVITEANLLPDWEKFLKAVFNLREEMKHIEGGVENV